MLSVASATVTSLTVVLLWSFGRRLSTDSAVAATGRTAGPEGAADLVDRDAADFPLIEHLQRHLASTMSRVGAHLRNRRSFGVRHHA